MMRKIAVILPLMFICCHCGSSEPNQSHAGDTKKDDCSICSNGAIIPGTIGNGLTPSDESVLQLNGVVWALAQDAVIWGTILNLEFAYLPIASIDNSELIDKCYSVSAALQFEILVEKSLYGSIPVGERIVVRVGNAQIPFFNPRPTYLTPGGKEVIWKDDNNTPVLEIGTRVGMGIRFVDKYDVWSLYGQPMFTTIDGNRIFFQGSTIKDGIISSNVSVNGLSLDEYQSLIIAARTPAIETEAAKQRLQADRYIGPPNNSPAMYFAASCSLVEFEGGSEQESVIENTNLLCSDGIDNDQNGYGDCNDINCLNNVNIPACSHEQ
jgi:hypothetical protein